MYGEQWQRDRREGLSGKTPFKAERFVEILWDGLQPRQQDQA